MRAYPAKQLFNHAKAVKGNMGWYEFHLRCLVAAYPKDKVFQKALAAETGNMVGGVGCVHYWIIEIPNGPTSKGVCRNCGAVQQFPNSFDVAMKGVPYINWFTLKSNKRKGR